MIPELGAWLRFFESRRDRAPALSWRDEIPLDLAERELIARSIATFQLGESSEGRTLIALARGFAARHGCEALGRATELFIREEQFHAALLAAFMKPYELPLLHEEFSDRVFRRLRKLAGFELAVHVLVIAELIALPYYAALAEATRSRVLRSACATILADERLHLAYEATLLAHLRARRSRPARAASRALHALLYTGAVCVVYAGHRRVLRAGGLGAWGFWRASWREFRRYFGGKGPTASVPPE